MKAPPAEDAAPPRSVRRRLAAALFVVWMTVLVDLAVVTSNPTTLNVEQILAASQQGVIVAVVIVDRQAGICRVERILASGNDDPLVSVGSELQVSNLPATPAVDRVILPLVRSAGAFQVVGTHLPHGMPLIYTDEAATEERIAALLAAPPVPEVEDTPWTPQDQLDGPAGKSKPN